MDTKQYFIDRVEISPTGCWIWQGTVRDRRVTSYGVANIDGKRVYAHRLSYELFKGRVPKGKFVLHHCDNKRCVNPDHLYAGTKRDNALDALARGQVVPPKLYGEQHPHTRITSAQVREIREAYQGGEKIPSIARRMGEKYHTVYDIAKGKNRRSE